MGVLFKTSVFGGFRKQEVIEYIEKLKSNSAEEVKQLEGERDAARRLEQQADEKAVLTEDRLAALQQELDQLREHNQSLRLEADEAAREAERARAQAEQLKREYSELKEYIADIELSAYKRAREVQEEAARQADEVTKSIETAGAAMGPAAEEAREKGVLAEEAFSGFKTQIATITEELDELVEAMHAIEQRSRQNARRPAETPLKRPWTTSDSQLQPSGARLHSVQEILDRVKNTGEKM